MKTIKEIYDHYFGEFLCGMIATSVLCVCAAFVTGSEFFLNAGLLLVSGAVVLPFVVKPQI